jgi:hypothetical protein
MKTPDSIGVEALIDLKRKVVHTTKESAPHVKVTDDGQGGTDISLPSHKIKITKDKQTGVTDVEVQAIADSRSTVGSTRAYRNAYDRIFGGKGEQGSNN